MRLADRLALFYSFLILLTLLASSLASAYSLADTLGEESSSSNRVYAEDLVHILRTEGSVPQQELERRKLAFATIIDPKGARYDLRVPGAEPLDSSLVEVQHRGYRVTLATSDQTVRREALQAVARQLLAGVPATLAVWLVGLWGLRSSVRPLELLTKHVEAMAGNMGRGEGAPELRQLAHTRGEAGGVAKSFLALDAHLEETIGQLRKSLEAQEAMKAELRVGRELQEGMLPQPLAPRADLELATILRPAREVGGDLYHHFEVGDKLLLAVGDVSGKGVSAALMMAAAQTLIRHCARESASLCEAVEAINQQLSENNPSAYFLTLFIGLYDPVEGRLEYVNAGHPRPLLRAADGRVSELPATGGMGLGVVEGRKFRSSTITVDKAESLVVFTDGVSEAQNPQGEFFASRLLEIVGSCSQDARAIASRIVEAVAKFEEPADQSDDLTLLVLRRC